MKITTECYSISTGGGVELERIIFNDSQDRIVGYRIKIIESSIDSCDLCGEEEQVTYPLDIDAEDIFVGKRIFGNTCQLCANEKLGMNIEEALAEHQTRQKLSIENRDKQKLSK